MVMNLAVLGTKNHCAGKGQQQFAWPYTSGQWSVKYKCPYRDAVWLWLYSCKSSATNLAPTQTNPSSCWRGDCISKLMNSLSLNKKSVMSPDRAWNQEQLCWRGLAATYWTELECRRMKDTWHAPYSKQQLFTYEWKVHLFYKYCVSWHYPWSYFYLKCNVSETGLCLHLQVAPTQLGPISRASPYLQTPAPTQDRTYKTSTAQTICES
jgi:hypothetical protein